MAEEKFFAFDKRANDLWEKITRDYLAGRLTNKPPRGERPIGGRRGKKRLAMTEGAHGAGVEQPVNLCDDTFTEFSPAQTEDAINDAAIGIPDNTKLYIEHFAGKWRITWADVCEP